MAMENARENSSVSNEQTNQEAALGAVGLAKNNWSSICAFVWFWIIHISSRKKIPKEKSTIQIFLPKKNSRLVKE